jgi:hypothetical protein
MLPTAMAMKTSSLMKAYTLIFAQFMGNGHKDLSHHRETTAGREREHA